MIYLDADFIFALLDKTEKAENTRSLQRDIVRGRYSAITSALALDEVMWVLVKNKKDHLLRTAIEGVYSLPNLDVIGVSPLVPMVALDMLERYKLKPRDSFHLAVMKESRVREILSDDEDFDRVEWVRRTKL